MQERQEKVVRIQKRLRTLEIALIEVVHYCPHRGWHPKHNAIL